ncbi:MAG: heme-binding protein [Emcibacter sp.]|nr:heme-binding protein [Emcibacter sp.]
MIKLSSLKSFTALALVKSGHEYAVQQGWNVAIAVVDQAGNLAAFSRTDGAPVACTAIAQDKAYTAASFGANTRELAENLQNEAPRVVDSLTACDRMSLFGGGVPIILDGETVGGVGVSGSSEQGDELCAKAAINGVFDYGETEK